MYEFWYDYAKPKYDEKAKFCYMDTDSFIVYIKANNIYKDIEDLETRLGENKNVIRLMENELGGKIMTKITYSYLIPVKLKRKKTQKGYHLRKN